MTVRAHALVSGHVQGPAPGVRGVGGSGVLLLPDRRVEVVLEGEDDAVERVLAELDGPRAPGRVSRVDAVSEPPRDLSRFTTE